MDKKQSNKKMNIFSHIHTSKFLDYKNNTSNFEENFSSNINLDENNTGQNFNFKNDQGINLKSDENMNIIENDNEDKIDLLLFNEKCKKLKFLNFPDLSFIKFNKKYEQAIHLFLDEVISIKVNYHKEKLQYINHIRDLQSRNELLLNQNSKLENIIEESKSKINIIDKHKVKEGKEKKENKDCIECRNKNDDINHLNKEIISLKNKMNLLFVEKKGLSESIYKIKEQCNKQLKSNKENNKNSFENIEIIKDKGNILKILSKHTGTEKLVESFQNRLSDTYKNIMNDLNILKTLLLKFNDILLVLINICNNKEDNKNNFSKKKNIIDEKLIHLNLLDSVDVFQNVIITNLNVLKNHINNLAI